MGVQELKKSLLADYKYRIELHAHTSPVSGCSEISPKEMVEIYSALGYSAVAITNHFTYQHEWQSREEFIEYFMGDFEETKKYGDERGIKVYLGAEIRLTENNNDYLVFGVDRKILEDIYELLPYGIENLRKNYPMPDSVLIQAHPMRDGMVRIDPALLDGMEIFNMHPGHNSRVGVASAYAKEKGVSIMTAGTDFHNKQPYHEGLAAIRSTYLPDDTFGLAKLLKDGNYLLELGGGNIIIP